MDGLKQHLSLDLVRALKPFLFPLFSAGFTLIELLVVITVIGVLAGAIIAIINPSAQLARARDAKRENDISQISKAIEAYMTLAGRSPAETNCDSSVGSGGGACPVSPAQSDWSTTSGIYTAIVGGDYLKILPKDPVNDETYYYYYEPNTTANYWIGAKLENPTDASHAFFRCATTIASTVGCRYVSNWGQ